MDFLVWDSNLKVSDCFDYLGNWVFPSGFENIYPRLVARIQKYNVNFQDSDRLILMLSASSEFTYKGMYSVLSTLEQLVA